MLSSCKFSIFKQKTVMIVCAVVVSKLHRKQRFIWRPLQQNNISTWNNWWFFPMVRYYVFERLLFLMILHSCLYNVDDTQTQMTEIYIIDKIFPYLNNRYNIRYIYSSLNISCIWNSASHAFYSDYCFSEIISFCSHLAIFLYFNRLAIFSLIINFIVGVWE